MRSRIYETVRCPFVCLSQHRPTQANPLLQVCFCRPGRKELSINCCNSGMRWMNAGSATLSVYAGSWTDMLIKDCTNILETAVSLLTLHDVYTHDYRQRNIHHAKQHFDPMTSVVSANSQFAFSGFFLSLIICVMLSDVKLQYLTWPGFFVAPTGRIDGPILWRSMRRMTSSSLKMCLLGLLLISHLM